MARASTRLIALSVVSALGLSACGAAAKDSASDFKGDQREVAQTVEDLQSDARKGDSDKICSELLAPELVDQIRSASKDTCEQALKDSISDADAFELQVQKVTVDGDKATAVVKSEAGDDANLSTLTLVRKDAAWKIATLGTPKAS